MDKFEIIKNFLLDESVSPEIRRERFDIAWDIRNHLDEVKKFLRQKVFEKVVEKLRNSEAFRDYEKINECFMEGEKEGTFELYKKNWIINGNPLLGYAIIQESKNFLKLSFGIVKGDKNVPFSGEWTAAEIPLNLKNILQSLQQILKDWNIHEWWIFWKYFDGFYALRYLEDEYEFYTRLISSNTLQEGINNLADYYVRKMVELKELTERYLDEFVELVKKHQMENPF